MPDPICKWYRLYVNSFNDLTLLWSIDEGTQETERFYCKVILKSPKAVATGTDLLVVNPLKMPKAWVSVFGVLREFSDTNGRKVAVITGK